MKIKPDIVIVHGPKGCGKTRNMYRIANYFGMNVIRDGQCCSEGPCPISLRKSQRVLYLCTKEEMLDPRTIERMGRYVAEGWVIRAIAYDQLPKSVAIPAAETRA